MDRVTQTMISDIRRAFHRRGESAPVVDEVTGLRFEFYVISME